MNAQDYISSGLLEAYVLGSLPLTESEQVAGAMCRFPEVAAEVASLESMLIQIAEKDAVPPPPALQEQIWAAIQAGAKGSRGAASPAPAAPATERTISFGGSRPYRPRSWARAAAWVALAGSLAMNLLLLNSRNTNRRQLADLRQKVDTMGIRQQAMTANLDRYRNEAEMAAQPDMQPVAMRSTQPGHPMAATVYWDRAKSEAYVSVQKLPPPPAGMQYQVWAIADGIPVSIGMLETDVAINGGMQKVTGAVPAGQAFAVSLEKAGGSPAPTPDKIFLMGKTPA